jgi:hypothetical protein
MAIKPGWQGRVFEGFEPGDIFEHPLGRTITQTDNIWFTLLTVNTNPIHFDAAYAARTEFKRPLVDSTFTLALVTGLSVMAHSIFFAMIRENENHFAFGLSHLVLNKANVKSKRTGAAATGGSRACSILVNVLTPSTGHHGRKVRMRFSASRPKTSSEVAQPSCHFLPQLAFPFPSK